MNKTIYFIAVSTLLLFSGGFSGAANKTTANPESIIFKLYEEHRPQNGKGISFNDRKTLSQYFTEDLTTLFLRNAECEKRTHSVCNLNMDPIFNAQDYGNGPLNLEVKKISSKPQLRYEAKFTNIERTSLVIELRKTDVGWRISDIIYSPKSSLRALLSQPQ
jgi:hypothetical protein